MTDADFLREIADRLGDFLQRSSEIATLEEVLRLDKIAGELELASSFLDSSEAEAQREANRHLSPAATPESPQ